jgi:hypothetical protein
VPQLLKTKTYWPGACISDCCPYPAVEIGVCPNFRTRIQGKKLKKAFWQVPRERNHVISNECEKSSRLQQATAFQDLSGLRPFEMTHLPLKMV